MPPFGPLYDQRVYVDTSLVDEPEIVFNAGTHADAIGRITTILRRSSNQ